MAEHYTLKWFDLEDTEGGGGSSLQPILHLTVTHSNASQSSTRDFDVPNYIEDGHVKYPSGQIEIAKGESVSFDILCIEEDDAFGVGGNYYFSSSDLVNCTVETSERNWVVFVADPTKEASATVIIGSNAD